MARAFRRRRDGRIVGAMDAEEVDVVVRLLRATLVLVAPEERMSSGDPFADLVDSLPAAGEEVAPPQDPALLRLLPPAHHTDTEQAAEFRQLTERTVRSRKAENLAAAIAALEGAAVPEVSLEPDQARALGIALTDVRLVLGERLGLRTDRDAEQVHELLDRALSGEVELDPALVRHIASYDFLTWLQETLTTALLRR